MAGAIRHRTSPWSRGFPFGTGATTMAALPRPLRALGPLPLALWASVYVAAAFVRLAPYSFHLATRLVDDGDALLVTWVLWWGARHLGLGWPGIFEANAFHPHPASLLYAEPLLAEVLVGWPLLRVFEPLLALNLLTVATFALSALAFHLLLRELVHDDAAAALGASLYAFNSYAAANAARVHIVSLEWLPLALLALHRLFMRGQARWAVALALFSALHGLACLYYLVFYSLVLAVLVPVYTVVTRAWRRPAVLGALAGAGLFCAAVLSLVIIPYLKLFHLYGFAAEARPFDLVLYFTPPRDSLVYGGLGDRLRPPGFYLDYFVGYVSLALGAAGLIGVLRARDAESRALWVTWLAIGGAAALLSAGADVRWRGHHVGTGPYALLQHVEPFTRIREPRRLAVIVLLCLSLFAARGAAALLLRLRGGVRLAAAALLTFVVVAEHWSLTRPQGVEVPTGDGIPDVYRWLAARPGAEPVADLPPRPPFLQRFMALDQYLSTTNGKPIMTGWPSFFPPALELLLWNLRDFPDARSIALLRAMGFRLAVVHPARWGADRPFYERRLAEREDVLPLLARFPDRALPQWQRYGLGGEEVRAIASSAAEPAPRECACLEVDRRAYRVDSSGGAEASLAVDGSPGTRWSTLAGQHAGMWFEVLLDRPRELARVEVEMAYPYGEFGRYLEVVGGRDAETWPMGPLRDIGYDIRLLRQLVADPRRARLRYDLRPAVVDRVRLSLTHTDEGAGRWSLPEIHVYELATPASPAR
jgi:hypothetical protein